MPPARKSVNYVLTEGGLKRPLPRHFIDLNGLFTPENINKQLPYLVLNVNEHSPEMISINRSGNTLTVETKTGDKRRKDEEGVEHVVRNYEIPEEGECMEEFNAQLSADSILQLGSRDSPTSNDVYLAGMEIPLNFSHLNSERVEVHVYGHVEKKEKNKEKENNGAKDMGEVGNGVKEHGAKTNGVEDNVAEGNDPPGHGENLGNTIRDVQLDDTESA